MECRARSGGASPSSCPRSWRTPRFATLGAAVTAPALTPDEARHRRRTIDRLVLG